MTVEDVKNTANLGPQASGCLAKTPPDLDNKSQEIPVAREGKFSCVLSVIVDPKKHLF